MNQREEAQSPLDKQDEEWPRSVDTLSHELKTPLTSIIAAAGLLEEELETHGEESYQKLIKNIIHNTTSLEAKLAELLEVIKTGGGSLQLKLEPLDTKSLLKGISWQINPVVQSSGKHFFLDLPDSLPLVHGDGQRLEQVILHLITNATKFTPEGSNITLRAKKRDTELVIEVQDSGPGISKEEQAKLFKPYS
ncbi:sensor histidine kinase [Chloroflexota bacterium]